MSQLASAMHVVPDGGGESDSEGRVAIDLGDRPDSIQSWILDHLNLYHERSERVLSHPTKSAADAMVIGAIDRWVSLFQRRERCDGERAGRSLESRLLSQSDDGLLDYLRSSSVEAKGDAREYWIDRDADAVIYLVDGVLNRRLYTRIASAPGQAPIADLFVGGSEGTRRHRDLEVKAAEAAGIREPGRILLVVRRPSPSSFGDILVGDGNSVSRMGARDDRAARLVHELEERLQTDWAVGVFADRAVTEAQRALALDWLASHLFIRWNTEDTE